MNDHDQIDHPDLEPGVLIPAPPADSERFFPPTFDLSYQVGDQSVSMAIPLTGDGDDPGRVREGLVGFHTAIQLLSPSTTSEIHISSELKVWPEGDEFTAVARRSRPVRWMVESDGQRVFIDEKVHRPEDGPAERPVYMVDVFDNGPSTTDFDEAYEVARQRCEAKARLAEHQAAAQELRRSLDAHPGDADAKDCPR